MTSNIKARNRSQGSADRAVQARGRAFACARLPARSDIEVGFAAERPGLAGNKARLPEPARRLTEREAAIVRGHADSIALRLACHDQACIASSCPAASRRARCSMRSSRRASRRSARAAWAASQTISTAMLDDRFHRGKLRRHHRPRRRADRGRHRHDRARAAHRRAAAADRPQARGSVAPDHRGARRPQSRPARTRAHRSAPLRRRGARPARFPRHGRGSQQRRRRGGGRRGRRGKPQRRVRRRRRDVGVRRQRAHEPGGGRGLDRGHAGKRG